MTSFLPRRIAHPSLISFMTTRSRAVMYFSGYVAQDIKRQPVQQILSLVGVRVPTSQRARERTWNIGYHILCKVGYVELAVHISSIYSVSWFVGCLISPAIPMSDPRVPWTPNVGTAPT